MAVVGYQPNPVAMHITIYEIRDGSSHPHPVYLDVGCGDGCSHPQPHPHPFNQNIRYIQNNFGCQNDFNRFIIRLRLSKLISNSF